jgi:hypothetical protein
MTDDQAIAVATRGMTGEIASQFYGLPREVQVAYIDWWIDRHERRASHRDALEAFAAGWHAYAGNARRARRGARLS